MIKISYSGYRFPPEIIQHAIWLYIRFTLSFRDVEDLLAERGIMVSYETVRRWVNHFGPNIAADLRKRRPKPHTIWHLDEVYLKIDGRMVYLWRAVDAEGEVLDVLVQARGQKEAAGISILQLQPTTFSDLHGGPLDHRNSVGARIRDVDLSPIRGDGNPNGANPHRDRGHHRVGGRVDHRNWHCHIVERRTREFCVPNIFKRPRLPRATCS